VRRRDSAALGLPTAARQRHRHGMQPMPMATGDRLAHFVDITRQIVNTRLFLTHALSVSRYPLASSKCTGCA
jgi:hypothetical protein